MRSPGVALVAVLALMVAAGTAHRLPQFCRAAL